MAISKILLVAVGGAGGALLRYAVSGWTYALLKETLPWDTLAANLAGCFLIGLLWTASEHFSFSPEARALVFTGVLGVFTTFSTYGLESINLLREGEIALGLANVLLSNLGGLAMAYLGVLAARSVLPLCESAA